MMARLAGAKRWLNNNLRGNISAKGQWAANKFIPGAQENPLYQYAAGAGMEAGVRLLAGQNPIQAIGGAAISEAAQGYMGRLARDYRQRGASMPSASNPGPIDPSQIAKAGRMGAIAGNVAGLVGSEIAMGAIGGLFSQPDPTPQLAAPMAMPPQPGGYGTQPAQPNGMGQVVPGNQAVVPNIPPLNEDQVRRAKEFELRKAATSAFLAQQLDQYPVQ
jgi:hypothetical protein